MAAILKRYLEYNRFITIEAYDRTRHYDLLVTNNPIHKKEQTPVYYLKTTWIWKIWQRFVSYYSLKRLGCSRSFVKFIQSTHIF